MEGKDHMISAPCSLSLIDFCSLKILGMWRRAPSGWFRKDHRGCISFKKRLRTRQNCNPSLKKKQFSTGRRYVQKENKTRLEAQEKGWMMGQLENEIDDLQDSCRRVSLLNAKNKSYSSISIYTYLLLEQQRAAHQRQHMLLANPQPSSLSSRQKTLKYNALISIHLCWHTKVGLTWPRLLMLLW